MARTEVIPAGESVVTRRTEQFTVRSGLGSIPDIDFTRLKRRDGAVVSEKVFNRRLDQVAGEQFGNTSLTILEMSQAFQDTLDRWALEDNEP